MTHRSRAPSSHSEACAFADPARTLPSSYDGTEVMWAKGSWGDIFLENVGRRSYKMSPRAVTCKDCRTPPVTRRKLLFGTFHDDHDDDHDMPCCPE